MNFIEPVKELFITESKELLEKMEQMTLEIESREDKTEALRDLFRCIHSIKGSSGMFGFEAIEYFLHHFENLLDELRNGSLKTSKPIIDLILKSIDHAQKLIEKPGANLSKAEKSKSEALISLMNKMLNHEEISTQLIEKLPETQSSSPFSEGIILEFSFTQNGFNSDLTPVIFLKI